MLGAVLGRVRIDHHSADGILHAMLGRSSCGSLVVLMVTTAA
jgi:hypothetical protein